MFSRVSARPWLAVLFVAATWVGMPAGAQQANNTAPLAAVATKPTWSDLSPEQQQALAPLAQQWNSFPEVGKRKWINISRNFDQLSAEEKALVQGHMRDWAALSVQQRNVARLNYADAKQLSQDEKRAKWEAYQALSPEAKQKLATQQNKPNLAGTAMAIKPVGADKLAALPVPTEQKPLPRIDTQHTDPVTLLPLQHSAATSSHP
jgi:hypothetical protein